MNSNRKFASIILAAGKGTRMGGDLPKVLHRINGRPMIHFVIECAERCVGNEIIVVVGYKSETVEREISADYEVSFAHQLEQLGTGHAVKCALPYINKTVTDIVILFGDIPLISQKTIKSLIDCHVEYGYDITMLTATLDDPKGYGRIVTCDSGRFLKIVEEKDADGTHKKIKEVNTGICCVSKEFLEKTIQMIGRNNAQNEFYFTDIIEIGNIEGYKIGRYTVADHVETLGVNTIEQLLFLEQYTRQSSPVIDN